MKPADSLPALSLLASIYANRYGVNIKIAGSTASCDGTTITIPNLDISTPALERILLGFVAHEAGHIRYSDYDVFKQTSNDSRIRTVMNILEDARIENLMAHNFTGVRDNLELVNRSLYKTQLNNIDNVSTMPKLQIVYNYIMYTSQSIVNNYRDAKMMSDLHYKELSCLINPQMLDRLRDYLYEYCPTFTSTFDVLAASKDIDVMFRSQNFFVPDFRRFAIRYNLTSAFDQENCIKTAALYGQHFDYPVICPSRFKHDVAKIQPEIAKRHLNYSPEQLLHQCYPDFICPKPLTIFHNFVIKPEDQLSMDAIRDGKQHADNAVAGANDLNAHNQFMAHL